ncbi:MAG: DUF4291 domain-containing protein [Planctomycetes bacterium]|nr:DUF4291 domain-containing protein [Planctomycetota bacterium]
MQFESYVDQRSQWPGEGRHVLAYYDDETIVVYQAFRPAIADEALALGRFGPSFRRSRMSWIKPNFLWMMFRSGWATKVGQERVLAVWLSRAFFERLLVAAVPAIFDPAAGRTQEQWAKAVADSDVRLQWDPDHGPRGEPLVRRALQLGLRRRALAEYADGEILRVEDMTPLVIEQRAHTRKPYAELRTPRERIYVPADPAVRQTLGLDAW